MSKVIAACLFSACIAFSANPTVRQVTYSGYWSSPVPTFDKGYVFAWDDPTLGTHTLYGPDGQKLYEVIVKPSASRRVVMVSAAIDTDGTLAVAYERWPQKGAEQGGIALLDGTGKVARFIDTGSYFPTHICFAPDHSIWTMGRKLPLTDSNYLVFHKFSRKGQQLGAFVPRSSLPAWEGDGLDQETAPVIGGPPLIKAADDRIGALLSPSAFKKEWTELDYSGNIRGKWDFINSLDLAWLPAAFLPDGTLYANVWEGHQLTGIAVLDAASGKWKPVPNRHKGHLVNADGDLLVFEAGLYRFRWVRP